MGACNSSKNHMDSVSDMKYGGASYDLDYDMFSSFSTHSIAKNESQKERTKKCESSRGKRKKHKRPRHQYDASGWRRLRSLPVKKANSKTLNPIIINKEEYIMIQTSIIHQNGHIPILHKYNNTTNKWSVLCEYPSDYPSGYLYTAALDNNTDNKDNHILYIWIGSYIITYCLQKESWTKHPIIRNFDCGNDPCSIARNNKFHIIGVDEHLIWDNKNTVLIQMTLPYSLEYFDKPSVYYWNDKFLLIGQEFDIQTGHDTINNNTIESVQQSSTDSVYEYNISSKQWRKMEEIDLPNYNTGGVLNVDENAILLFGGQFNNDNDDKDLDNIYEIQIDQIARIEDGYDRCKGCKGCMMRKSKLKCPRQALYFALLMKSDLHQKWIINGYLRKDCYQTSIMWIPSNDIIKLIGKYYEMYYVVLIDKYNGSQWRICLDEIENKLQQCDVHKITKCIKNAF